MDEAEKQNEAARKIQSIRRGQMARAEAKTPKAVSSILPFWKFYVANFRGADIASSFAQRNFLDEAGKQNEAAKKIQSIRRGQMARAEVNAPKAVSAILPFSKFYLANFRGADIVSSFAERNFLNEAEKQNEAAR